MIVAAPEPMARNAWVPFGPADPCADLSLVCFAYAGGGAVIYRDWFGELPRSIQAVPVEFAGRGTRFRETPLRSVAELAQAAADALQAYWARPYVLFGHSLGALVAYELARLQGATGRPPIHLFVSGHRAPHVPATEPPAHLLPSAQFRERLRSWGGVPAEVMAEPGLMTLLEPVLRADLEAAETYRCSAPREVRCPVTAFAGLEDPLAPPDLMAPWSGYTSDYFALRAIPGDHFFLRRNRPMLLASIVRELELAGLERAAR